MFPMFPKFTKLPFTLPTIFTGTIFRTREAIGLQFQF